MTPAESIKASGYTQAYFARLLWPNLTDQDRRNRMSAICTGKKPMPDELKRILEKLKIKYDAPETKNK